MAAFNPDQNPTNPDFTSDSKGMKSKDAVGDLFGNAGGLGIAAVKIADQNNLQNIQREVHTEVDRLNNEWGTSSSAFETSVNSKNIQPLPSDLQRYGKQLGDVRKAFLNGSLKESNYQMRIDSMSRQIRARYPGYREEIDSIVGKTLGQSTANDLRKALMSEWATEAAKMDDDDKRYAQEVTQARKDGTLPPDWDRREASGNPYSKAETRVFMASRYQQDADMDRTKKALDLQDKTSEAGKKAVFESAQKEMALTSQRMFEGGFSVMGMTVAQFREKAAAGLVKPFSDVQNQEIVANFAAFKAKVESEVTNRLAQPEYATLTKQQRDDLKSTALAQVEIVQDAILNQQYGLVNYSKTMNDTTIQNDIRRLSADPVMRLRAILKDYPDGQMIIDKMLVDNPQMASNFNNALTSWMTGELFSKDHKSLDGLLQETQAKTNGNTPPEVIKQNTQNAVKMLLQKDASFEVAQQAAQMLFSEENQAFLGHFTTKSQDILFKTLISPRMTERMIELGKSDPQMFENYRNWTLNSFGALFNQDFNTLVDNNKFGDDLVITWDAERGIFKAEANPESAARGAYTPGIGQMYKDWANSAAGESMNRLNDYVKRLKPILEAEGGKTEDALTAMLERFGINDVKNEGSFFFRVYSAIEKGATKAANQAGESGANELRRAAGEAVEDTPEELNNIDLEETGSGKMSSKQPRGIRNNNPGNIEYGSFAKGLGAKKSDGRFAVFDSPEQGIEAMKELLKRYQSRGLDTVGDMIRRWSPSSDGNNSEAYAKRVADAMGIGVDEPFMFQGDIANTMIHAMIEVENGQNPYKATAK